MSWHIKIRRGTIDQTASRNFRRKSRGSSQTRQGSVSHPKYKKKNHDAINLFIGKITVNVSPASILCDCTLSDCRVGLWSVVTWNVVRRHVRLDGGGNH